MSRTVTIYEKKKKKFWKVIAFETDKIEMVM